MSSSNAVIGRSFVLHEVDEHLVDVVEDHLAHGPRRDLGSQVAAGLQVGDKGADLVGQAQVKPVVAPGKRAVGAAIEWAIAVRHMALDR